MSFDQTASRVESGERLQAEDLLVLLQHPNLAELGLLAYSARSQAQQTSVVTYSLGGVVRWSGSAKPRSEEAATSALTTDEICRLIDRLSVSSPVDLCLYASTVPSLSDWAAVFNAVWTGRLDTALCCSLSTQTVIDLAAREGLSIGSVLESLQNVGLTMLRGEEVGPPAETPLTSDAWMAVHEEALAQDLPTTAAIPETITDPAEQVKHLLRIRDLHDRTGLIHRFVPGPIGRRPAGDPMRPGPALDGKRPSAYLHLRLIAAARCALDNIPYVQTGWEAQGAKIGEVALRFGADHWGSTGLSPSVNGSQPGLLIAVEEIERLVRDSGHRPWPLDGRDSPVSVEGVMKRRTAAERVLTVIR